MRPSSVSAATPGTLFATRKKSRDTTHCRGSKYQAHSAGIGFAKGCVRWTPHRENFRTLSEATMELPLLRLLIQEKLADGRLPSTHLARLGRPGHRAALRRLRRDRDPRPDGARASRRGGAPGPVPCRVLPRLERRASGARTHAEPPAFLPAPRSIPRRASDSAMGAKRAVRPSSDTINGRERPRREGARDR